MTLEEEIASAESRRFSAILRADAAELLECLDESLVYVHSNGLIEDRATYIEMLVSGGRRYLSFTPGKRALHVLGDTVACIGELGVESHAGRVSLVYTAVYRRTGSWKMVLWHACAIK